MNKPKQDTIDTNRIELSPLIKETMPHLIVVAAIIILSGVTNRHDVIGFLLIVMPVILAHKLYDDVKNKITPVFKSWWLTFKYTAVFATGIYYLFQWLKGYGFIGLAVLVLLFAGYRVYKGRQLFIKTAKFIGGKMK